MKLGKQTICSLLIMLFYAVGLMGFLIPRLSPLFLQLVPYHLLLMLLLLIISHHHRNRNYWLFLLVTFLAGFFIEVLGVSTGYIFGAYQYGSTLGVKLADVPLLIGVNWVLLIYSTGVTVRYFNINNQVLCALIGAFFLVMLDILIEPVAIRFDYWGWTELNIPFQNYIAWFVFSFLMLMFFFSRQFRKKNPAAVVLLVSQLLFFVALNLWA